MAYQSTEPRGWQPTLGAVPGPNGTRFRLWAPKPSKVELVLRTAGNETILPMERSGEYWEALVPEARAGARYLYRLDGGDSFPDPCSRSQPDGVHDASEVVDPLGFEWQDSEWRPPDAADLVIYEAHIGTLTQEGTFDAAVGQLPRLKRLGVNAVEVMPVASFAGRWNWGYDGVDLFAPAAVYGGPEGFREFVNAAHNAGLAVILDVVYNHFGPDGNYTGLYSDRYVTEKHTTPWGNSINFDDEGSANVRRFFVENLLHWVYEYHVDGFRFDAAFAIQDSSRVHMLAEFSTVLAEQRRTERRPYLIAETHENDVRYLKPVEEGGFRFDAVWADDFHHIVRTIITGEHEGYFSAYEGRTEDLARILQQGFFYEGQYSPWSKEPRGTRARVQPWHQFLYCIQNHDQVGNRAFGDRLNVTAAHADFLAASMLLLLLPQTPMLFQGQEFLASTPFMYFTDHNPELGKLVTEGRRKEFGSFAAFSDPALRELIPDPQDPWTFYRSGLRLDEAEYGIGRICTRFYSELLGVRGSDPVLRKARRRRVEVHAVHHEKAVLAMISTGVGRRAIAVNFGDETTVELDGVGSFEVAIHTGEPRFGGTAIGPEVKPNSITLPRHSAAFLIVST